MYFIDPHPVVCEACKVESEFAVKDLMRLTAVCPACEHSMRPVGERMRESSDAFSKLALVGRILHEIEYKHKIKIPDPEELDDINVSSLIDVVQSAMPGDPRVLAEKEVAWGIGQMVSEWGMRIVTAGYDKQQPLLEALVPKRFEEGW